MKERVADAVRPRKRAAQQKAISVDGIVADEQDENAADDESCDDSDQREKRSRANLLIYLCFVVALVAPGHQQSNLFHRRHLRIHFACNFPVVNYE